MKVRALKLRDERFGNQWFDEAEDRWDYEDFKSRKNWREGWISMDCALYDEENDKIFLGITSFDADIFKAYDRKTGKFEDLGYGRIADRFDAKFHRSIVKREADGCIYAAVALLHEPEHHWEAPGGAIIKYDPRTGDISKVAIPVPHTYIQAISIDQKRDLLYCVCFPPEILITYDLKSGEVRNLGFLGTGLDGMTQSENLAISADGTVWGPHCLTRAWQGNPGRDARRLFRIKPGSGRIDYLKTGLPKRDGSYGYERMDAIFDFEDGYIYASGSNGSIYRIDPETGAAEYLFTPITDRPSRLSAMAVAKDGCAYGVTGRAGKCELLRFDFRNTKYDLIGDVSDTETKEACWQVHDLVITPDGTIYACENDNPYRSGYLWEISGAIK